MIQIRRRHATVDFDTGDVRHRDLIVVHLAQRHAIDAHRDRAQLAARVSGGATILITAGHDALEREEPAQARGPHLRDLLAREEKRKGAIGPPALVESGPTSPAVPL